MVFVYGKYPSLLGRALAAIMSAVLFFLVFGLTTFSALFSLDVLTLPHSSPAVDKIFQLTTSQLRALNTKNKRDGVHEIRFAGSIRPNHRSEVFERPYNLVSSEVSQIPVGVVRMVGEREKAGQWLVSDIRNVVARMTVLTCRT